ncbi:unnamed protein product [Pleuronectes platessa]|uniref:Secreted protein n=1 Tax=Pleuronectes platessa TaxID=8262 RepID=A0A9N7UN89_PLEPL|nr:unnamed protein product [Pleuronectes platessa]
MRALACSPFVACSLAPGAAGCYLELTLMCAVTPAAAGGSSLLIPSYSSPGGFLPWAGETGSHTLKLGQDVRRDKHPEPTPSTYLTIVHDTTVYLVTHRVWVYGSMLVLTPCLRPARPHNACMGGRRRLTATERSGRQPIVNGEHDLLQATARVSLKRRGPDVD